MVSLFLSHVHQLPYRDDFVCILEHMYMKLIIATWWMMRPIALNSFICVCSPRTFSTINDGRHLSAVAYPGFGQSHWYPTFANFIQSKNPSKAYGSWWTWERNRETICSKTFQASAYLVCFLKTWKKQILKTHQEKECPLRYQQISLELWSKGVIWRRIVAFRHCGPCYNHEVDGGAV